MTQPEKDFADGKCSLCPKDAILHCGCCTRPMCKDCSIEIDLRPDVPSEDHICKVCAKEMAKNELTTEKNLTLSRTIATYPIELDSDGTARWKANPLVRALLDLGTLDMNKLACLYTDQPLAHAHFAQLIGYSISGWGELSYVPDELIETADHRVETLE